MECRKLEGIGEQKLSKCICQVPSASSAQGQLLFLLATVRSADQKGREGHKDVRWGWHENVPRSRKITKADSGGLAQTQSETTVGKMCNQHATINWHYLPILPLSSHPGIQLFCNCHPGLLPICPTEELLVLPPECLHYISIINYIVVIISNENQA